MKLLAILLAVGASITGSGSILAADLAGVKTVYLLPMAGGLDQYLANRLTRDGAFQVVTDPQKADAVFTDRIGANFEQTIKDLYTPKAKSDGKLGEDNYSKPNMQPLSHGKGEVFLVDRASRVVLWSLYARPKSGAADDMNQLATKIVEQLEKSRKGK